MSNAPVKPSIMAEVDRRNAVSQDTFVFAREEWKFVEMAQDDGPSRLAFAEPPRPGTWTPPCEGLPANVLALVCCPKCKSPKIVILQGTHHVDEMGRLSPDFRHHGCDFARKAYLDRWNKKPLYAIAVERKVYDRVAKAFNIVKEIHYCHASNAGEARFHLGPGNYRVVAVGPAVGALAVDEHGERAVADLTQLKN